MKNGNGRKQRNVLSATKALQSVNKGVKNLVYITAWNHML
jgi:hypothetical protein